MKNCVVNFPVTSYLTFVRIIMQRDCRDNFVSWFFQNIGVILNKIILKLTISLIFFDKYIHGENWKFLPYTGVYVNVSIYLYIYIYFLTLICMKILKIKQVLKDFMLICNYSNKYILLLKINKALSSFMEGKMG